MVISRTLFILQLFFAHQPRMCGYYKKESVELFVYLVIGIWRRPSTNKQYPTLVQYGVGTEYANTNIPIQAMSVIAVLVLF